MDFPVDPASRDHADPATILGALGLADAPILQCAGNGGFILVPPADAAAVPAVDTDFRALKVCTSHGVIVTAQGEDDTDFVSRMFALAAGIDEDPVTSSAHCVLTPYWADILGTPTMTARQISPRGGDLICTLKGDRVMVEGKAVSFSGGKSMCDVEFGGSFIVPLPRASAGSNAPD